MNSIHCFNQLNLHNHNQHQGHSLAYIINLFPQNITSMPSYFAPVQKALLIILKQQCYGHQSIEDSELTSPYH